jgi:hypothetical protein
VIDFFVSHSWHDDGEAKYRALEHVALEFKRKRGRCPFVVSQPARVSQSQPDSASQPAS